MIKIFLFHLTAKIHPFCDEAPFIYLEMPEDFNFFLQIEVTTKSELKTPY